MNPDVDFMVENEIVIIKTIKLRVCEEDYGWNPRICVCGCDKDFEIGKYLEDWTYMRSLFDDAVVICDKIVGIPETTSINPTDKSNYLLITSVLLAIPCLSSLVFIVVKCYMKHGLTISCSLLDLYIILEYESFSEGININ